MIGIKNVLTLYHQQNNNDESESESSCIQLPPIIKNIKLNTINAYNEKHPKEKIGSHKYEYSHHASKKKAKKPSKFAEDLIKVDKAMIYKKTFMGIKKKK